MNAEPLQFPADVDVRVLRGAEFTHLLPALLCDLGPIKFECGEQMLEIAERLAARFGYDIQIEDAGSAEFGKFETLADMPRIWCRVTMTKKEG